MKNKNNNKIITTNLLFTMQKKCICHTNNKRKCKNGVYINIEDRSYCYIHGEKYYGNIVKLMQTSWQTYKKNKAFNIYINLPNDIKNIIKYKVNEDYYIEKKIKIITNNKLEILKTLSINFNNMYAYNKYLYNTFIFLDKYTYLIPIEEFNNIIKIANHINGLCIDIISYIEDTDTLENMPIAGIVYKNKYFYKDFSLLLQEFNNYLSLEILLNNNIVNDLSTFIVN